MTGYLQTQLVSISNDLSCSVFGMAVFVTMSYYYLLFKGEIEDSDKVCKSCCLSSFEFVRVCDHCNCCQEFTLCLTGTCMDISCSAHWQCGGGFCRSLGVKAQQNISHACLGALTVTCHRIFGLVCCCQACQWQLPI